jgi:hypothetical protein
VFGDGDDIAEEVVVDLVRAQRSGGGGVGGGGGGARKRVTRPCSAQDAGNVVVRFMTRAARRSETLRAVASATLPPAVSGASVAFAQRLGHHGFTPVMTARRTIRAMQRFVGFSGLCDHRSFGTTQNAALRLLRCFDVCANNATYSTAAISDSTAAELRASAAALCETFDAARGRILRTQVRATACEQQQLETRVTRFNVAMTVWHTENCVAFRKRVRVVLFNLYDVEAVLREGAATNEGCGVRKPFLLQGAENMLRSSYDVSTKFLSRTSTFGGSSMLQDMDREYATSSYAGRQQGWLEGRQQQHAQQDHEQRARQDRQRQHPRLRPRLPAHASACTTTTDPAAVPAISRVLASTRTSDKYDMGEVHHESVVDPAFQLTRAHLGRDDPCLAEASLVYDQGREANLRLQLEAGAATAAGPSYRHLLITIVQVREHLMDMEVYQCRGLLEDKLDDVAWKRSIDAGTLQWGDASSLLQTVLDFMRYCVGSESARAVIYRDRKRQARRAARAASTAVSCHDAQLVMVSKTKLYDRMARRSANKMHVSALEQLHERRHRAAPAAEDRREDRRCHALDHKTFAHFNNRIEEFTAACKTTGRTTSAIFGEFIVLLVALQAEMNSLDVLLSNAAVTCIRMQSRRENILEERRWFEQRGLCAHNTLAWLQKAVHRVGVQETSPADTRELVWHTYVALIMDPGSAEVQEEHYPELLVLDIAYIQRARAAFHGQVAQAATLVILGQRLTELGGSRDSIASVLHDVTCCDAFAELGAPETRRGDAAVVHGLQASIGARVRDATGEYTSIVSEAVRETCHVSYPASRVARTIAAKWASVARDAFRAPDAFASPEATLAAFSTALQLPYAARFLSPALYDSIASIVARCNLNLAVHARSYKTLAAQLE